MAFTYPACRAVLAARKQRGLESERAMIAAIQSAYYQKAMNPSLPETLVSCAKEIGLDENAFQQDLRSADIQAELQKEMGLARRLGANGFPSLRLMVNEAKVIPIDVDYRDPDAMFNEVKDALSY